jgi:hypothetical protein
MFAFFSIGAQELVLLGIIGAVGVAVVVAVVVLARGAGQSKDD